MLLLYFLHYHFHPQEYQINVQNHFQMQLFSEYLHSNELIIEEEEESFDKDERKSIVYQ